MPSPIRTLSNARDLADLLSRDGRLTHAELAEALNMPRASVYRLVEAMAAIDLVRIGQDGLVAMSSKWLHLSDAARAAMTEWDGAADVLHAASEVTGQSIFLCVPRLHRAFCIDWAPGRALELLVLRPGRSLAPNAGGAGRLTLAYDPAAEEVLESGTLERLTPATLVDPALLREDIARTRSEGRTISLEDATVGIGGIAVPVLDGQGRFRASLSAGGLAGEIRANLDDYTAALRAGAQALTSR
ncbi:IclR family transcriptional regulator [Microbacterium yannicii]|uniref:IclR family transcriptional regulator n=1 Tax=Microbacterium yannicii TaxID=671622 RepID=UPI000301C351|nr:IclR family transcriptional regulator C-terminal domain-containing protein [Microbacterium yannicii]